MECSGKFLKTIVKMAVEDADRSAIWIDIQPDLTGFRTTFWVSCEPEYPYFIVDPTPGNLMYPTKACQAFHYWKSSTYPEIDAWMKKYKILLMKLLKQRISAKTFYMQLPSILNVVAEIATTEEGQMIWTEIQPSMSGIIFTFWVSYEPDHPFIIIDPVPGGRIVPTDKCQAFDYWKKTPYPEIDSWMKKNRKAVMDLLRQKIDSVDFYIQINKENSSH